MTVALEEEQAFRKLNFIGNMLMDSVGHLTDEEPVDIDLLHLALNKMAEIYNSQNEVPVHVLVVARNGNRRLELGYAVRTDQSLANALTYVLLWPQGNMSK